MGEQTSVLFETQTPTSAKSEKLDVIDPMECMVCNISFCYRTLAVLTPFKKKMQQNS